MHLYQQWCCPQQQKTKQKKLILEPVHESIGKNMHST